MASLNDIIFFTIGLLGTLPPMVGLLYVIDRQCKNRYFSALSFYRLKKSRYFFVFMNRKKGDIVNSIFWFWIIYYIIVLYSVCVWVLLLIFRTRILMILLLCAMIPLVLLIFAIAFVGYHYKKRVEATGDVGGNVFQSYYDQEQKDRANKFTNRPAHSHLEVSEDNFITPPTDISLDTKEDDHDKTDP